ncbi:unnamed protein product [Rotaria magnacalcarata]
MSKGQNTMNTSKQYKKSHMQQNNISTNQLSTTTEDAMSNLSKAEDISKTSQVEIDLCNRLNEMKIDHYCYSLNVALASLNKAAIEKFMRAGLQALDTSEHNTLVSSFDEDFMWNFPKELTVVYVIYCGLDVKVLEGKEKREEPTDLLQLTSNGDKSTHAVQVVKVGTYNIDINVTQTNTEAKEINISFNYSNKINRSQIFKYSTGRTYILEQIVESIDKARRTTRPGQIITTLNTNGVKKENSGYHYFIVPPWEQGLVVEQVLRKAIGLPSKRLGSSVGKKLLGMDNEQSGGGTHEFIIAAGNVLEAVRTQSQTDRWMTQKRAENFDTVLPDWYISLRDEIRNNLEDHKQYFKWVITWGDNNTADVEWGETD